MPPAETFDGYFHDRASRFAAFYRSEPWPASSGGDRSSTVCGGSVDIVGALGARRVLDVGCGSGPLFAPARRRSGVHVTGIDPAPAMVASPGRGGGHPGLVTVQERGWEAIDEVDAYDVAVALGVFDYVDEPSELLRRMGRAG